MHVLDGGVHRTPLTALASEASKLPTHEGSNEAQRSKGSELLVFVPAAHDTADDGDLADNVTALVVGPGAATVGGPCCAAAGAKGSQRHNTIDPQ